MKVRVEEKIFKSSFNGGGDFLAYSFSIIFFSLILTLTSRVIFTAFLNNTLSSLVARLELIVIPPYILNFVIWSKTLLLPS